MPFLLDDCRRLEHRARLHRRDLGIADAEAAAAEAEHRVELVQLLDALVNTCSRHPDLLRQLLLLLLGVRQELVQRRIEEADRRRVALERAEDAGEVLALVREQLGQRRLPLLQCLGEDHLAHRVDAVSLEEHVLGAGQADADRAERHRVLRLFRRVRVGADAHTGRIGAPLHQLLEVAELLRLLGRFVAVDEARDDLRRRGLDLSRVHLADRPVDRHPVAFLERLAVNRYCARLVVDLDCRGATDADLAHLPGDERRV